MKLLIRRDIEFAYSIRRVLNIAQNVSVTMYFARNANKSDKILKIFKWLIGTYFHEWICTVFAQLS